MADGAPVRRGRKFDQVIAGARAVFLAEGYEGAAVDDIARAAGVSKATLYSYFPDKRLLFLEVAKGECGRQAEAGAAAIDTSAPVAEMLGEAARQILRFVTSDVGLRMFRICVAEAERFPEIGREFLQSGPAVVRGKLLWLFGIAVARGELRLDDPELAAAQFQSLCKADLHERLLLGGGPPPTEAEIARIAGAAVATFLARYGSSATS